jgi:hypothetical protein
MSRQDYLRESHPDRVRAAVVDLGIGIEQRLICQRCNRDMIFPSRRDVAHSKGFLMYRFLSSVSLIGVIAAVGVMAQAPVAGPGGFSGGGRGGSGRGGRVSPTRDPHTDGYVTAKELNDGDVPSATADGNFIIGPTHNDAAEMKVSDAVPQGAIFNFTMESTDS